MYCIDAYEFKASAAHTQVLIPATVEGYELTGIESLSNAQSTARLINRMDDRDLYLVVRMEPTKRHPQGITVWGITKAKEEYLDGGAR